MPAKRDDRQLIIDSAMKAIKDNVLARRGLGHFEVPALHDKTQLMTEIRPCLWRCGRPDTGMCSFWVAEMPGCIVQWGDIGGITIAAWGGYDLAWLEKAIDSIDYVFEKSTAKRTRFVASAFAEYIRSNEINFEKEVGRPLDEDPTWEDYDEYVHASYDSEVFECSHDYETDAFWAYAALKKFCELRKAARG